MELRLGAAAAVRRPDTSQREPEAEVKRILRNYKLEAAMYQRIITSN